MDSTIINNWFGGELVDPNDMFDVNTQLLSTLFSSNSPGSIFNIIPTIDTGTMTFATTEGFAFFGVTTDPSYITNTGSTTLGCTVEAQNSLTLVNLNCYIYVQPIITLITGTRYTQVTGECYSSTNASDVGIKICDVINGVATNFDNNNIRNYFDINNNVIKFQNPDSSSILLYQSSSAWNRVSIQSTSYSVQNNDGFVLLRPAVGALTFTADSTSVDFPDGFTWSVQTTSALGVQINLTIAAGTSTFTIPPGADSNGDIYTFTYSLDADNWSVNGVDQATFVTYNNMGFSGTKYLGGGFIMQWDQVILTNGSGYVATGNFPVAFPVACISMSSSAKVISAGSYIPYTQGNFSICPNVTNTNPTTYTVAASGGVPGDIYISYIAIGFLI